MTSALANAALDAARTYGTPLYLYDLPRLAADAQQIRKAFPDPWLRLYSLKANGLPGLVREIATHGFGLSAVSGGELALAERAGVGHAATALEGIGKSDADLRSAAALAARRDPLLWVSLETAEEAAVLRTAMERATRSAPSRGRRRSEPGRSSARQDVLVRINPAVAPETHRGLAVGAPASKFGCLPEELPAVIEAGGGTDGPLRWRGLHVHVGSQLGAVDAWRSALRVAVRVLELQRAALPDFDTLDVGGGFPVAADAGDSVPAVRRFAEEAAAELAQLAPGARPARLAVEPGRAVVAGCGWIVGRVLHVRQREPAIVVLDAGMTELIRPALYGARHPLMALTSLGARLETSKVAAHSAAPVRSAIVRVDGPVCESTDSLGDADLPPLRRGDVVAIGLAGAYASAMASTYNGRPRPPELAWDGERLSVMRRRGSVRTLP